MRIPIAFAIVYLVWGSTYLAIRIGVEHLPPALFAGSRFVISGLILLAFALAKRLPLPKSSSEWLTTSITGFLMLVLGNGLVTWSEQWVESNQAALLVATAALWIAMFGTIGNSGDKLSKLSVLGQLIGFAGVAVLVGSGISRNLAPVSAYLALIAAPIFWAIGSVVSRRSPAKSSFIVSAGLQMLVAGIILTTIGIGSGELSRWTWHTDGVFALIYLIVFGSCIAYAAYYWLINQVSPSQLGTYAYVNPAVAVVLGWLILNEEFTSRQMFGAMIILAGVCMVTYASRPKAKKQKLIP